MTPPVSRCAACGGEELQPHLAVRGDPGAQGLIPSTDRFGVALSDIVRCPACGHMQLERFPSPDELEAAYAAAESTDYVEEEAGQRATARIALDRIERHVGRGRLLDLGCWVGFLLDEARTRGWRTTGVEPSEFASRYARARFQLDVRTENLLTADLEPGSFDAVVLGDVIEHLTDPGGALVRIARLARPGGLVYLALPDAGSRVARTLGRRWWSILPTHVQYFTRGSLATLLTRQGWQVLEVATAPKAFSVRYYVGRLEGYSEPIGRGLVRLSKSLGAGDRIWAPDFRDRMAFVARAPGVQVAELRPMARTP